MNTLNSQHKQIHDIAAAELRQIFIDAICYGFRSEVLAEKVKIPVGASGIDRQAYAIEILEHVIKLRPPSVFTAKANRMDLHFAAALSLHWSFLEELSSDPYRTVEDLAEIATFFADETIKSCAPAPDEKSHPEEHSAEIVQLSVTRPLKVQFEMAANILDDFDVVEYSMAGIVDREKKLLELSHDIAQEIHMDEVSPEELQGLIHRSLTVGFNSLFFLGDDKPTPEHIQDNFEITKATMVDKLTAHARQRGLTI